MVMFKPLLLNVFAGWFRLTRWFPTAAMARIRDAIAEGERRHAGELCFAVESRYSPWEVLAGLRPRQRAEQAFSLLRVWDTERNSGVLLYLQLAERRVEIVADRGIVEHVDAAQWQAICDAFAADIANGPAEAAALAGIQRISDLLAKHFPAGPDNPRELPDQPVIL
jgi:hypothetical protein